MSKPCAFCGVPATATTNDYGSLCPEHLGWVLERMQLERRRADELTGDLTRQAEAAKRRAEAAEERAETLSAELEEARAEIERLEKRCAHWAAKAHWAAEAQSRKEAGRIHPQNRDTGLVTRTPQELIDAGEDAPLPLSAIPNLMGINLCAVESLAWTRREDGQLVDIVIRFKAI